MEKILEQWYANQNKATKAILKKVVAKKVFTIIADRNEPLLRLRNYTRLHHSLYPKRSSALSKF